MLLACLGGLLAGALHVVAGPDHLAALAPLSIRTRGRAWSVGLRWGLGHSAGVLAVAALAAAFRLPLDLLSGWCERLVGASLIALGLWSLRRNRLHAHVHEHGGEEHVHVHAHAPGETHSHVHAHAAFGIGALHGLAGTAHLLGVLPALALSGREAAAYLGAFAAGGVLSMTAFASVVGWAPARRWILNAASVACVGVGAAWLVT